MSPRIGILGGGQLARMLALSAHKIGVPVHILGAKNSPASQVTAQITQGDIHNPTHVQEFIRHVDILSFESDYNHPQILDMLNHKLHHQCASSSSSPVQIHPHPQLMKSLTHRLECKEILENYGFQSAPYATVPSLESLHSHHELDQWGRQAGLTETVIFKRCTGGYDGRGTLLVNLDDQHSLDIIKQFFTHHAHTPIIAETHIKFSRELAITAVRSRHAEIFFFPLVETKQTNYQCDWVNGPVMELRHLKSSATSAAAEKFKSYQIKWSADGEHLKPAFIKLIESITTFLTQSDYVGAITFELFEVDNQLIVNEVSPRVHNSCHYSLNAMTASQFDLHIKAILGWPLGKPSLVASGFAMTNLIGSGCDTIRIDNQPPAFLHWYGKDHNRSGRKMGHLNTLAHSKTQALNLALKSRHHMQL